MDTDTPVALPRLDAHPEHHTRAWLYPAEEQVLDAHTCVDLSANLTVSVLLREHRDDQGRRKKGTNRAKLTPEQSERERRAGRLIGAYSRGAFAADHLVARLAALRRDLHYARLGQEPPAIPEPEPSPAVAAS